MNLTRHGQHLLRIQSHHLPLLILPIDGEKIQQLAHLPFARLPIASATHRRRTQVIGELLKNHQRPRRVKIKHIRILLAPQLVPLHEQAGILRPERRLHIQRRTLHIAQHQDRRPLRHRHPRRQLPDGKRNRPLVGANRRAHLIQGLERRCRLLLRIRLAIASRHHHLVLAEDGMRLQLLRQRLGAVHAVQQPETMLHLAAQSLRRKGKLLLPCQSLQKPLHRLIVLKRTVTLRGKKLIQVKSIGLIFAIIVKISPLLQAIAHYLRHPVRIKVQLRQGGIGIFLLRLLLPLPLGALFIGIGPVENRLLLELFICQSLKRRPRQMQRRPTRNLLERHIRPVRIHPLVRLIHNQQIPGQLLHMLQLIELPAEIQRTLQILQRHKLDIPLGITRQLRALQHMGQAPQSIRPTDEIIPRLRPHKTHIIIVPRMSNRRTIRHNQHRPRTHLLAQIIRRQSLAETRLGIPQKLRALPRVARHIEPRPLDRLRLLRPQHIRHRTRRLQHPAIAGKLPKMTMRHLGHKMKPLRIPLAFHLLLAQVTMKRLIVKHRPVGKTRRLVPFQAIAHIHRLRLLADAHLDIILLGVANLRPALVSLHLWSRVGVTLRLNLLRASDRDGVHRAYSMGLIFSSIKATSSADKPYLAYSCRSISATDRDQSISLAAVKSWRGTKVKHSL